MGFSGSVAMTSSPFRALGAAIRTGVMYAPQLLRRRWLLYMAIVVVASVCKVVFPGYLSVFFIVPLALSTAWYFMLKDTLIADDPGITITRNFVVRYSLLSLWLILFLYFFVLLSATIFIFVVIGLLHAEQTVVRTFFPLVFFPAIALVYTRLTFVYFAIVPEDRTELSFATSWRLTGHRAFLPTLTLTAVTTVPVMLTNTALIHFLSHPTSDFAALCVSFVSFTVALPISLQWMHSCERINAKAYARPKPISMEPTHEPHHHGH